MPLCQSNLIVQVVDHDAAGKIAFSQLPYLKTAMGQSFQEFIVDLLVRIFFFAGII